jgi:hypothetical protein
MSRQQPTESSREMETLTNRALLQVIARLLSMTKFHLSKKNNSLDFSVALPNIMIKQTVGA